MRDGGGVDQTQRNDVACVINNPDIFGADVRLDGHAVAFDDDIAGNEIGDNRFLLVFD